jgi:UDP-glucose 4-epimerase
MHILITGGAGFIGSHVVDALLLRGDQVTVLDDCSTGALKNIAQHHQHPRFTMRHGSVCDEVLVDDVCHNIDAIIHLAAAVGVQRILDKQVGSIVTNLRGTEVMLRAAHTHGRIPIILASTSEVYGKLDRAPFREDDGTQFGSSALHRWSYACSKLMDEFLGLAYFRERQLPVTIARFFNVTGPRQSSAYGMVLPRFCEHAVRGSTLPVHGSGEQTRCFLHVYDAVSALLALLACHKAIGQVVNIGSDEEISMRALAEKIIHLARSSSSVQLIPYSEAFPHGGFEDMMRRVPDVTRLQQLTGWQRRYSLDATINDFLSTLQTGH